MVLTKRQLTKTKFENPQRMTSPKETRQNSSNPCNMRPTLLIFQHKLILLKNLTFRKYFNAHNDTFEHKQRKSENSILQENEKS